MDYNWTPAELAAYDQYLARANENITSLSADLKQMIADEGEPTAMAHLTLSLIEHSNPQTILGLITVALRRIALDARS
jgi:hypothetical protein